MFSLEKHLLQQLLRIIRNSIYTCYLITDFPSSFLHFLTFFFLNIQAVVIRILQPLSLSLSVPLIDVQKLHKASQFTSCHSALGLGNVKIQDFVV